MPQVSPRGKWSQRGCHENTERIGGVVAERGAVPEPVCGIQRTGRGEHARGAGFKADAGHALRAGFLQQR